MNSRPEVPGSDSRSVELAQLFRDEFPRLRTNIDHFFVSASVKAQWHADLHTCSRRFEAGWAAHGGFYCREVLGARTVSFFPPGAGPFPANPGAAVKLTITLVRAALDNPLLEEPAPPVI